MSIPIGAVLVCEMLSFNERQRQALYKVDHPVLSTQVVAYITCFYVSLLLPYMGSLQDKSYMVGWVGLEQDADPGGCERSAIQIARRALLFGHVVDSQITNTILNPGSAYSAMHSVRGVPVDIHAALLGSEGADATSVSTYGGHGFLHDDFE